MSCHVSPAVTSNTTALLTPWWLDFHRRIHHIDQAVFALWNIANIPQSNYLTNFGAIGKITLCTHSSFRRTVVYKEDDLLNISRGTMFYITFSATKEVILRSPEQFLLDYLLVRFPYNLTIMIRALWNIYLCVFGNFPRYNSFLTCTSAYTWLEVCWPQRSRNSFFNETSPKVSSRRLVCFKNKNDFDLLPLCAYTWQINHTTYSYFRDDCSSAEESFSDPGDLNGSVKDLPRKFFSSTAF